MRATRRLSLWHADAAAQPAPGAIDAEIERKSENPLTRSYTLSLRFKSSFEDGFYGGTTSNVEISNALIPVPRDEDWFLITRSKGAFVSQAPKTQAASWANGLNNAQTTLFISPAKRDGLFWGAGPVISFPNATTRATGNNQWGAGPSVAFSWQRATHRTLAFVANNVWGLGATPGGGGRSSNLLLNPTVSYRFGDGWSLSSSPEHQREFGKNCKPLDRAHRLGHRQGVQDRGAADVDQIRDLLQCGAAGPHRRLDGPADAYVAFFEVTRDV